jgi:hypothetical protein
VLVCGKLFLGSEPGWQMGVVLVALLGFLAAQRRRRPFAFDRSNGAEEATLVAAAVCLACGLLVYSVAPQSAVLGGAVVLVVCAGIGVVVWTVGRDVQYVRRLDALGIADLMASDELTAHRAFLELGNIHVVYHFSGPKYTRLVLSSGNDTRRVNVYQDVEGPRNRVRVQYFYGGVLAVVDIVAQEYTVQVGSRTGGSGVVWSDLLTLKRRDNIYGDLETRGVKREKRFLSLIDEAVQREYCLLFAPVQRGDAHGRVVLLKPADWDAEVESHALRVVDDPWNSVLPRYNVAAGVAAEGGRIWLREKKHGDCHPVCSVPSVNAYHKRNPQEQCNVRYLDPSAEIEATSVVPFGIAATQSTVFAQDTDSDGHVIVPMDVIEPVGAPTPTTEDQVMKIKCYAGAAVARAGVRVGAGWDEIVRACGNALGISDGGSVGATWRARGSDVDTPVAGTSVEVFWRAAGANGAGATVRLVQG